MCVCISFTSVQSRLWKGIPELLADNSPHSLSRLHETSFKHLNFHQQHSNTLWPCCLAANVDLFYRHNVNVVLDSAFYYNWVMIWIHCPTNCYLPRLKVQFTKDIALMIWQRKHAHKVWSWVQFALALHLIAIIHVAIIGYCILRSSGESV